DLDAIDNERKGRFKKPGRTNFPDRHVDFSTIVDEGSRLRALLGPGDEDHLLMALRIYYHFVASNLEIFDNPRLLEEGGRRRHDSVATCTCVRRGQRIRASTTRCGTTNRRGRCRGDSHIPHPIW